jgi:hypothetical protein
VQVRDKDGPYSLSGVTSAEFYLKNISTDSVIISAAEMNIVDTLKGIMDYHWAVADTAVIAEYAARVLLKTASGEYSFPRNGIAKIIVEDKYSDD